MPYQRNALASGAGKRGIFLGLVLIIGLVPVLSAEASVPIRVSSLQDLCDSRPFLPFCGDDNEEPSLSPCDLFGERLGCEGDDPVPSPFDPCDLRFPPPSLCGGDWPPSTDQPTHCEGDGCPPKPDRPDRELPEREERAPRDEREERGPKPEHGAENHESESE